MLKKATYRKCSLARPRICHDDRNQSAYFRNPLVSHPLQAGTRLSFRVIARRLAPYLVLGQVDYFVVFYR